MGNPGRKFQQVKADITPYLFHFISGYDINPKATLTKILEENRLTSTKGYICFTASPITGLHKFFQTNLCNKDHPMYCPFGIGFARDILIKEYGARNLIYSSIDEWNALPNELLWRADRLDIDSYDFEWLREWRIKGSLFDFHNFPKEHIIVIAPGASDLLDIVVSDEPDVHPTGNPITGEMDCYIEHAYKRKWKGFTLKQINLHTNDFALSGSTINQIVGDDMCENIIDTLRLDQS